MDTFKCGICSELLSEGAHCTVCSQDLHFHCAGITEAGYRKLGDRKLMWRCGKCKQSGSGQPTSPRIESEQLILKELKIISEKLLSLDCLKDEVSAMRAEFSDLKNSLKHANEVIVEFSSKIKDIEHRLSQVEKTQNHVDLIHARLEKLEDETRAGEQWARMNNVEIKGVPQANNENLMEIVSKIGSHIKYPINKMYINFITRVPTRDKENFKPIIVCFCARYTKEDFVAAARCASKSSPLTTGSIGMSGNYRIFVNDHLTIRNKDLLAKTKKAAAEKNFRYVWVKHAKIHARKTDTSHIIVVKSEKDLSKIV